ncbi:MAG: acetate--CoA ligase [Desulfobacteraceae bacterium]|nr:MAG: acetate--CoA ligase [Desulfobacteraceae bacterium]
MPDESRLRVLNKLSELKRLGDVVTDFGKNHGLSERCVYGANLAMEELFVNIVSYAYDDLLEHEIQISLSIEGKKLTITVEDDGKEFNPAAVPDRPTPRISFDNIEDIELGLRLVRMVVDAIDYGRRDGRNILTLVMEDVPNKKAIASMLREERVFQPPEHFREKAGIKSIEEYKQIYRRSIEEPENFWADKAEELEWFRKWDEVLVEDFSEGLHEWFVGGKLNLTVNCLDRHLSTWRKNKAAIIWEGDNPGEEKILTYRQLHREVCRFANVMKKHGVRKGDRVSIYLPMVVELPIAMLACARIGAIHSVVFGGFSAESLKDRILDCDSRLLICANGYTRGGKVVKSKEQVDRALQQCPNITDVIVVRRIGTDTSMMEGRDFWWDQEICAGDISNDCAPEVMDAEDPLFILYTSGSTGKPKGVLHTTAGYLVYVMQTFKWIFDIKDEDTYWCTADIGWITGHSYIVYGPLANGATSLMFEGIPNHPRPDRFWHIVEKHAVTIFYTAPTALRALMKEGNQWPSLHDLSTLRLLGTVGEPINPKAWMWYYETIGGKRCPIVDTWWQTETGGIVISPIPGAIPCKPGSATLPFFGIQAEIIRSNLDHATMDEGGWLVIKRPWPGLMRRVYGDPERFRKTYFSKFPSVYTTGDGAKTDEDGYFWIMGRIDDVINVSGHRLGTAELESVLVSHAAVAEAAVVGMPHETKGQGIYAFVTLKKDAAKDDALVDGLRQQVRNTIGPIAIPDRIQFADALPKTRSGKIMRRLLVRIAAGDVSNLGDTTTLLDESVIVDLIRKRAVEV